MPVDYQESPPLSDQALNELFASAWPSHRACSFQNVLARSSGYIAAFSNGRLVGFVNVASDGGHHAFLLDPTVHKECWRQGIGSELVRRAAQVAVTRGCEWLHVDFKPALRPFYAKAGFKPTEAGLLALSERVHAT